MKAGMESRTFSEGFGPRKKATRGACYRGGVVLLLIMPALRPVCAYARGQDGT